MVPRKLLSILFLHSILILSLNGETIELLPIKDNSLYEPEVIDPENPSVNFSNGIGDYLFAGRTSTGGKGKTRRALLKFDLSAIPAEATITSASLRLYLSNTIRNPEAKIVDVELRRILADWGEGQSDAPVQEGGGATVTEGDASWFHSFFATQEWTIPGGDFAALPTGIESVGDKFVFYTWNGPGLVGDIQSWLAAPQENFGWIVISDESETETAKRFDSRESFNFSSDNTPTTPVLTIDYTTEAVSPTNRLINVSTRGFVDAGENILIAGIVISGDTPRRVLFRGIGPSLTAFDVPNALQSPSISLFKGSDLIVSHNQWPSHQIDGIQEANTRTGAFAITPENGDVAFIADLDPGVYSLHLGSNDENSGNALIEAYEIDPNSPDTGRFINISTRGFAGEGDSVMIAGFAIPPGPDRTLLIRGIGPGLASFDVTGFLSNPTIQVISENSPIAENDDWTGSEVAQAAQAVNAFPLPVGSADAALITTLPTGIYSVILSGAAATGVALVEVYEVNN